MERSSRCISGLELSFRNDALEREDLGTQLQSTSRYYTNIIVV